MVFSVDSNRHLLVGLLDEALAALPCNDHICPNCYKRIHRPSRPQPHNLLDALTAAADAQPPTPPLPPSPPSTSAPPPPPPPPPVTFASASTSASIHLQRLISSHRLQPLHSSLFAAPPQPPSERSLSASTSSYLTGRPNAVSVWASERVHTHPGEAAACWTSWAAG